MQSLFIKLTLLLLSANVYAQTNNSQSSNTQNQNTLQSDTNFIDQLVEESQCDPNVQPICYYKAYSTVKLFQTLQNCSLLKKWVITYTPPSKTNLQISITAGDGDNCNVIITNMAYNPPQTKTCILTPNNIQSMNAYPEAQQYLAQYDQTQQAVPDQVMYSIFGAFYGCMKGPVSPQFLNAKPQT